MTGLPILALVVALGDSARARGLTGACLQIQDEVLAQAAQGVADHAESAAMATGDPLCAGIIFSNVATLMNRQGRWAESEKFARKSVRVLETVVARDDPVLLPPYHLISANSFNQDQIAKAREAFRRMQQIRAETPRDRMLVHGAAAALLRAEGKLRAAESEYLLELDTAREAGLSEAPDGAIALTGLGGLYIEQKRFDDARRALDQATQILAPRKESDPVPYMEVILAKALLCTKQGFWRDAGQNLHEFLDIAKEKPPDTGLMASVFRWYAFVLRKTHNGREAHSFETRAAALGGQPASNAVIDVTELAYASRGKTR